MSLANLDGKIAEKWTQILSSSKLVERVMSGEYDKRFYAIYLLETYHYTRHNSRNQALVATRREPIDVRYLKFCLHHAEEETGHEFMALHDLKSIGYSISEQEVPSCLSTTETLIAYLYHISAHGNPLRRLGYSFWAESVYSHIGPVLKKLSQDLQLRPSQMTFFVAHSEIDASHSAEVRSVIEQQARTEQDWKDIEQVALTSLELTARMIDEVEAEFTKVLRGEPTLYSWLAL